MNYWNMSLLTIDVMSYYVICLTEISLGIF